MKLLVCVSKTPETTSAINFVDGGKALDTLEAKEESM